MNTFFAFAAVLTLSFISFDSNSAPAPPKPNVIVILTDDQGMGDVGCYGAKDIPTPSLDSLAARGIRFTQFYCGSAMCSPSRAALLTGRYPLRCGVTTLCASQRTGTNAMPTTEITMAQMFKAAGYATAHVGKWHLGYTPETMPNARGFDYSFGNMGGCIDNYSHFYFWSGPNVHDLHRNSQETYEPGKFFGDLMLQEAARFMKAHRKQPFFIYYAPNQPHYPYQPDVKWLERCKHLPFPRNLYAAFVATLDERIGALLKEVDRLGLRERTIVVFHTDNGHSTEERAHFGGGSAGPYRGAKFSFFEGGLHVPCIVSWPGHLPQGQVRQQITHSCDWLPTLAELCGLKILNPDLDGRSLTAVLKSATAPSPHDALHFFMPWGGTNQWAVRAGDYKLMGNVVDTTQNDRNKERFPLFLANLAEDPGEKLNLVDKHPDVVARLQKLHDDWVKASKPIAK
jgi:arylsulfatase A-like enzyme